MAARALGITRPLAARQAERRSREQAGIPSQPTSWVRLRREDARIAAAQEAADDKEEVTVTEQTP